MPSVVVAFAWPRRSLTARTGDAGLEEVGVDIVTEVVQPDALEAELIAAGA